ncbi:TlyA family RNA methyltransferase [Roseibium suaedae]|uniref:23S rRNA (Cytidine1920-2'-O)/16S rRNA (Cytidine1409-2'-O)-methyltransferase n=1 Tax=Roseibium suaedae TaxID=735517 RepID=A0A1M7B7A2_9HYPH|nr:TlyA family RNA methyltransferase [Roseibium suaedae]SHL50756.1 23S rRNA (cytidine1920-2'-O)/16S rRNA (cytidine1409-2'-O)-methyltransferase [Roseibium suaedae]
MSKQRLDQHLVDTGNFPTRARARDAILRGTVSLDGIVCLKPAQKVATNSVISVADPAAGYVSRAALKLIEGLDAYQLDPAGLICLDIGASTGGFTQVLLERGAAKVHAIDVGHDQLHDTIASNPNVRRRDGLNARDLTLEDLGGDRPQFLVSDVSFISLKLALPPALDLATPGAKGVFLVKPQFEAGRENIGKGGLVDPQVAEQTAHQLRDWLAGLPGWSAGDLVPSPVKGGDGNAEWLLSGYKND